MSTLVANQGSAKVDHVEPFDVQDAYDLAAPPYATYYAETNMKAWLAEPAYRAALGLLCVESPGLFVDVEVARRKLDEASGPLGPDGLRESPEIAQAEENLQGALEALRDALMARKIRASAAAHRAPRPKRDPSRARVSA